MKRRNFLKALGLGVTVGTVVKTTLLKEPERVPLENRALTDDEWWAQPVYTRDELQRLRDRRSKEHLKSIEHALIYGK